ncbi:MAG: homoserine kinase [Flavobacteriaceae bacterium]|nr:homoserine kinase [Flavobacteriaceae bacterium]
MIGREIRLFCPATIANVSCGFDVLGLCLDAVGDQMIVKTTAQKGVRISKITGQDLPLDPKQNVAGVAVLALLDEIEAPCGFEIKIHKNIKPGSGIGSSAASSSAAVFGVNHLLGNPFQPIDLVRFAMEGEALASGTPHADNVAPAIYGGFTLVRSTTPLDIVSIPTPAELVATVIHPQIELKTKDARAVLKQQIPLSNAITQWGNVGGLISSLFLGDYELLSRSLVDVVVEPHRALLIPGFDTFKHAALEAGALGSGISGSGPSIFALSKGLATAQKVAKSLELRAKELHLNCEIHISKINTQGIRILS